MQSVNVATWNTEWRKPHSKAGHVIRERLRAQRPDIVCLTECYPTLLKLWGGYAIESGADWGYNYNDGRREVLLWSRWPWSNVDVIGSPNLPQGRFVSGVTSTPLGQVTVIGLVIPYHFSHVRHGRRDRKPWQEHCLFLEALAPILRRAPDPKIVLGDFNQRLPSAWTPATVQRKLLATFAELEIVTRGSVEYRGARTIDHIACDRSLSTSSLHTLSNIDDDGLQLSDHFGVGAVVCGSEQGPAQGWSGSTTL